MQNIKVVEESDSRRFEKETNELFKEGYKLQSSTISHYEVGSYDEHSIYQAILLKEE